MTAPVQPKSLPIPPSPETGPVKRVIANKNTINQINRIFFPDAMQTHSRTIVYTNNKLRYNVINLLKLKKIYKCDSREIYTILHRSLISPSNSILFSIPARVLSSLPPVVKSENSPTV